ncbi:MAG: SRPBCC family protein [Actinomycetota bacterium]
MHLEFDETFDLPPAEIYDYFKTPQDWGRLYGAFGDVTDRGDGWFAVPMRRSPFPLVAKMTVTEPETEAAWDFKGFWKGHGEVHLEAIDGGTRVTGYETVTIPRLLGLGPLLEKRLEPFLVAVWESGWRRLRKPDQGLE